MSFFDVMLDVLYPAHCVSCAADGDWWCAECRAAVELVGRQPCPRCLTIERGHETHACSGSLPFHAVTTTGFYHSPPLRLMIAALKYDGLTAAASSVDAYLSKMIHHLPFNADSVLIPMPLSEARLRERGFNQAEWVAERLSRVTGLPVERHPILIRRKGTPQADLTHDDRLRSANVRGQFRAIRRFDRPILLVDDVVTTGSTAAEAARALLAAGTPSVSLFTLAIGK